MLFLLLLLNFDPFCSCMLSAHAHLLWWWHGLIGSAPLLPLLGPKGLPIAAFCCIGPLGVVPISSFTWTFSTLSSCRYLQISYCVPFSLIIGLSCCWALFIKNRPQHTHTHTYIYIYGWFQVRFDVTLNNVTQSNNLLKNLYFENFTVRLHVLYVVKMQAKIHSNRMLFTIRSIYSSFIHYFF